MVALPDATTDAGVPFATDAEAGVPLPRDAEAEAATDAELDPTPPTGLTGCTDIRQAASQGRTAEGVVAKTLRQLTCEPSEAGETLTSGIYYFEDETPLLLAGQRYSVRWDQSGIHQLQLSGGEEPCATRPVHEELNPDTFGLAVLPDPKCRSFTPDFDVTYLRIPQNNLVIYFLPPQLCAGACPGE